MGSNIYRSRCSPHRFRNLLRLHCDRSFYMKADKKQIIEAIGIASVVASLLFVGIQLLLDRRLALAEQYFDRSESVKSDLRSLLESDAYYRSQEELWEQGVRPVFWDEESETAQLVREGKLSIASLHLQMLQAELEVLAFDNNYFRYQQGLLNDEFWLTNIDYITRLLARSELYRYVFETRARPTVRPVLERIFDELD